MPSERFGEESPASETPEKRKVVIVDISESVKSAARDAAEAKLTATKKEAGWFKRIWKYNWLYDYYLNKETREAHTRILERKNIYAEEGGTADEWKRASDAIVERFTTEGEEMLHEREKQKTLGDAAEDAPIKDAIKEMIRRYAQCSGDTCEDDFLRDREILFRSLPQTQSDTVDKGLFYSDNLLDVAKEVKKAASHEAGRAQLDFDFEVVLGTARTGTRTEAELKTFERVVNFIERKHLSPFVNETTLAAAVSIATALSRRTIESATRSKAATWVSWGLGPLVGSAFAAFRESKRLKEERAQHAREMAQGKKFDATTAERRRTMEAVRHETRGASDLAQALESSLYAQGREVKDLTKEEFEAALANLADIETRIRLSDTQNIDLIHYSDVKTIEQERLRLDKLRAQAKVDLHKMLEAKQFITLPDGMDAQGFMRQLIDTATNDKARALGTDIESKNRQFTAMRRKQMGWAAAKAAATGFIIGGAVQEGFAFLREGQEGMAEYFLKPGGNKPEVIPGQPDRIVHHYTPLGWLRRYIDGTLPPQPTKTEIVDGVRIKCPENVHWTPNDDNTITIFQNKEVIADRVQFVNGKLPSDVEAMLHGKGFSVVSGVYPTTEEIRRDVTLGPREYIDRNTDLFTKIRRTLWYDNDTRKPIFDKNELKLWWGGVKNTGIDEHGNYVFNIKQMLPSGSYHGKLSANAQELMKEGKLKLLLSLSRDTQNDVIAVPFDGNGNAIIKPTDEAAKLFETASGKARFLGQFAEVAETRGPSPKDGVEQMRILATHVGKGLETTTTTIVDPIPKQNPWIDLDCPPPPPPLPPPPQPGEDYEVEGPWFIPIVGRRPLERARERPVYPEAVYPLYPEIADEERESLLRDMSPRLRENPDAQLDPATEIAWYFDDQEHRYPGYRSELSRLNSMVPEPMSPNTEAVVALAVAGHQEHKNIYRTLETYAVQQEKKTKESVWKESDSKYEIILYVNYPKGKKVDKTLAEIERFRKKHPEVPVRVYTEEITNGKVEVGWYKKKAFDLALLRHQQRGILSDILIIANDADMVYTSPTYLEEVRTTLQNEENNQYDALLGRQDLDPAVYGKNPTFHAAMRFWQFMEAAVRAKHKMVGTQGRNTVLRGSSYAAIGGNRTKDFWADIEFGKLLAAARPQRHNIGYLNRAWVMVDPRREIDKFKSGELIANTWNDFNERQNVRGAGKREHQLPERINIEQLARADEQDPQVVKFRNSLEEELRAIVYAFGPRIIPSYAGSETARRSQNIDEETVIIQRAAEYLGVRVNILTTELVPEIIILDTQKLRQRLLEYHRSNRKEAKIKTHPLYGKGRSRRK